MGGDAARWRLNGKTPVTSVVMKLMDSDRMGDRFMIAPAFTLARLEGSDNYSNVAAACHEYLPWPLGVWY